MVTPALDRLERLAPPKSTVRPNSTPPNNRVKSEILTPITSPFKGYLSPDDRRSLPPRSLTLSPAPRLKEKTRKRLAQYHTFQHAVDLLRKSQGIVLLTGAGISTSLDIPDFRSDDGFYSKLSSSIGVSEPEEFFSINYFSHNSETFWKHAKPLIPRYANIGSNSYKWVDIKSKPTSENWGVPKYSPTHAFLKLLEKKKKLLTNYTQNIDGLEFAAGVKPDKIIQCHGSWDTATCLSCGRSISAKKYLPIVFEDGFPRCKCVPLETERKKTSKKFVKKRKRLVYEGDSDHDSDDGTTVPKGLFKPDITFFGEPIPEYYVPRLEMDKSRVDLLVIMGTSLKVKPVKTMVTEFPPSVPTIWINRDRFSGVQCDMPGVQLDIELLGECDVIIKELCDRAGWKSDLAPLMWQNGSRHVKQPVSIAQKIQKATKNETTTCSTSERGQDIAKDSPASAKHTGDGSILGKPSSLPIRQHEGKRTPHTHHDQDAQQARARSKEADKKPPNQSDQNTGHQGSANTASAPAWQQDVKIDLEIGTDWRWRITKTSK